VPIINDAQWKELMKLVDETHWTMHHRSEGDTWKEFLIMAGKCALWDSTHVVDACRPPRGCKRATPPPPAPPGSDPRAPGLASTIGGLSKLAMHQDGRRLRERGTVWNAPLREHEWAMFDPLDFNDTWTGMPCWDNLPAWLGRVLHIDQNTQTAVVMWYRNSRGNVYGEFETSSQGVLAVSGNAAAAKRRELPDVTFVPLRAARVWGPLLLGDSRIREEALKVLSEVSDFVLPGKSDAPRADQRRERVWGRVPSTGPGCRDTTALSSLSDVYQFVRKLKGHAPGSRSTKHTARERMGGQMADSERPELRPSPAPSAFSEGETVGVLDPDKFYYEATVMRVNGRQLKVQWTDYPGSELVQADACKPMRLLQKTMSYKRNGAWDVIRRRPRPVSEPKRRKQA